MAQPTIFLPKWRVIVRFEGAAWPEHIVEARDKWDALCRVAEEIGIAGKVPMSVLWPQASIKKGDPKISRKWRTLEAELKEATDLTQKSV